MSKAVADKAKKYYPHQWNKAYLDALLKKGALTQDEYNQIVHPGDDAGQDDNTND